MQFYTALRSLSYRLSILRGIINGVENIIDDIVILKTYIAPLLSYVVTHMGHFVNVVDDMADAFLDFRNYVVDNIGGSNLGTELFKYADMLIGIAKDPAWFIRSGINQYFPDLVKLADSLPNRVIEILQSKTGLTGAFLFNPLSVINGLIGSAMGDLLTMAKNPRGYIIELLSKYDNGLRLFLDNPRGYLQSEIKTLFPDLAKFINDPDGYIIERTITGLEKLINSYWKRIAKIAEDIINRMF